MSEQPPDFPLKPPPDPEGVLGYSPEDLLNLGMGFLLDPSIPEPDTYKPLSTGSRADPNEPLEPLDDQPTPDADVNDKYRDPSQLWGYSPKDLKRLGMGTLIPPTHSPGKGGTRTARSASKPAPQKGSQLKMDTNPPTEIISLPQQPKRKRGGQPGNLNGLKHGLYIEGARIRNTTPLERAELFDIYNIINYIKDYIQHTYESGLLTKDLAEINETMRSLSLAGMSLTRLIAMHDQHVSTPIPSNIPVNEHTNILKIVEHYKKKLAPIVDLSDLDLRGLEQD